MLEIRDLNIATIKELYPLVRQLSFTLNNGDKCAVIGQEGTGKSTLLKSIVNPSLSYADITGDISVKGKIGYLAQDTKSIWYSQNTLEFLLKDIPESEVINPEAYEKLEHLSKALNQVEFPYTLYDPDKLIKDYSGGEVIKLALAKLLMNEVDIFLLDEPTNDLDFNTILFLEAFIKQTPKPILYISHDETLLKETATMIIHLTRTKKQTEAITYYEKLDYTTYKNKRLRDYESTLMKAKKQRADHQKKIERFKQIYQKVKHQQDQTVRVPSKARLLAKKMKSLKSTQKRYDQTEKTFEAIPEKEDVIDLFFDQNVEVHDNKQILKFMNKKLMIKDRCLIQSLSISVVGPKKIAIIGDNGSGKTTLLKMIYDHLLHNHTLSIGMIPQDFTPYKEYGVLEFLKADHDTVKEAHVRKMLGSLLIKREDMKGKIKNLSGGQITKVFFLKMVLEKHHVLLLDEPTRNLSPLSAPEIHELLATFKGCIICVTHDRTFIETVFDKIYRLESKGLTEL